MPELITSTPEQYEALAVEFDSALCTQHIEDAYAQMYERYPLDMCPDHILSFLLIR